MKKLTIAFDVDDTLIIPSVVTGFPVDTPNYENIAIFKWFQAHGHTMVVWSGGGEDYARMWAEKLGLKPDMVSDKSSSGNEIVPDICFDDCDVDLAKINVKVKRINNSIDRSDWNKHKTGS